ncbi:MAG TPA: LysE family transporter [Ktedonobacterales bacterium]|nr:LysE family transporter [Ktedonobacterales bacterium]
MSVRWPLRAATIQSTKGSAPMPVSFLLRGLLIGFSIAAPVGPIGVLCIRRTLALGRLTGFVTGLGAATADFTYGCVAAFGLTAVSSFLLSARLWIHLLGGLFLAYLGVRTILSYPAERPAATGSAANLGGAYASTVVLTLTNPATILSFAAVFAGLGIASTSGSYGTASALVAGVFIGSVLWWLLLSSGVSALRSHFNARLLIWVNRVSGCILLAFGLVALVSLR